MNDLHRYAEDHLEPKFYTERVAMSSFECRQDSVMFHHLNIEVSIPTEQWLALGRPYNIDVLIIPSGDQERV